MSIKRRLEKLGRGIGPNIVNPDKLDKRLEQINKNIRDNHISKLYSKQRELLNKGKGGGIPGGPAKGFHKPQGFSPKKFVNKVW